MGIASGPKTRGPHVLTDKHVASKSQQSISFANRYTQKDSRSKTDKQYCKNTVHHYTYGFASSSRLSRPSPSFVCRERRGSLRFAWRSARYIPPRLWIVKNSRPREGEKTNQKCGSLSVRLGAELVKSSIYQTILSHTCTHTHNPYRTFYLNVCGFGLHL